MHAKDPDLGAAVIVMANLKNSGVLCYLVLPRQPHSFEIFGKAILGQQRSHLSEASLGHYPQC